MRVRSVTLGSDVRYPVEADDLAAFEVFQRQARARFDDAGLDVQSVRLATQPFPSVLGDAGPEAAPAFAQELETACRARGLDYCSVGPVMAADPENDLSYISAIPELIRTTEAAFASVLVAESDIGINLEAITQSAEIVSEIAHATPQGFGNLRLAILANCRPGSPFFPVSYHGGGGTRFSVATEAADLAVEAFSTAANLREAEENLRCAIEEAADVIEGVSRSLAAVFGFSFGGIDFSLAPYPETERSIGRAIEELGVDGFGGSGTLFAVALMKRAIEKATFSRCGFSGVMLPVLEDLTLAERSAEGTFDLDSLLLYSTVCGTGLDTVPLSGDVSVEELAAILLDVATLSIVADKPLTARLMPIPGKRARDLTDFDFEYFANGRVVETAGKGASRVFERAVIWRP